jgi:hypothetical protein
MVRLHRLTIVVDIIGLAFVCLAFLAFVLPDELNGPLDNFLQNFSVEMIGTWVSVRLIDLFINERAKSEEVRVRILRNCRFWLNQLSNLNGRIFYRDLANLQRELKYTLSVYAQRVKFLRKSEVDLYRTFANDIEKALLLAGEILDLQQKLADYVDVLDQAASRKYRSFTGTLPESVSTSTIYRLADRAYRTLGERVLLHQRLGEVEAELSASCDELMELCGHIDAGDEARHMVELIKKTFQMRSDYVSLYETMQMTFANLEMDIREETPED